MIVFAPGSPVWNVVHCAPWSTHLVIAITAACGIATPVLVLLVWFKAEGLRCVLAIGCGLVAVVLVCKGIAHVMFISRPFVVHHFRALFPHATNTSFPSTLTAYFAVVAVPRVPRVEETRLVASRRDSRSRCCMCVCRGALRHRCLGRGTAWRGLRCIDLVRTGLRTRCPRRERVRRRPHQSTPAKKPGCDFLSPPMSRHGSVRGPVTAPDR